MRYDSKERLRKYRSRKNDSGIKPVNSKSTARRERGGFAWTGGERKKM
jgi:hypothetical protein